jgi:hypothetical protein
MYKLSKTNEAKLIYFFLVLREREGKNPQIFRTLDGGVGRTLCANGLPTEEGSLFRKIWSAAALGTKYLRVFSSCSLKTREKYISFN